MASRRVVRDNAEASASYRGSPSVTNKPENRAPYVITLKQSSEESVASATTYPRAVHPSCLRALTSGYVDLYG